MPARDLRDGWYKPSKRPQDQIDNENSCVRLAASNVHAGRMRIGQARAWASRHLPNPVLSLRVRGLPSTWMRVAVRTERSWWLGRHEPKVKQELLNRLRPGMTVFNVGAYIGYFALVAEKALQGEGTVVAFEPDPDALERLRVNLALNRSRVVVECLALADAPGEATFSRAIGPAAARFLGLPYTRNDGSTFKVSVDTLDGYIERSGRRPDFLLIDAEHSEGRVLRGGSRYLAHRHPTILIELHEFKALSEGFTALRELGYTVRGVESGRVCTSAHDIRPGSHVIATA